MNLIEKQRKSLSASPSIDMSSATVLEAYSSILKVQLVSAIQLDAAAAFFGIDREFRIYAKP